MRWFNFACVFWDAVVSAFLPFLKLPKQRFAFVMYFALVTGLNPRQLSTSHCVATVTFITSCITTVGRSCTGPLTFTNRWRSCSRSGWIMERMRQSWRKLADLRYARDFSRVALWLSKYSSYLFPFFLSFEIGIRYSSNFYKIQLFVGFARVYAAGFLLVHPLSRYFQRSRS